MNSLEQEKTTTKFLIMWCSEGLETLINLTKNEQENIIAVLKDEPVRYTNPIQYMIMRARYNPQRHYEIYVVDSELDEVSIEEMFNTNPQVIVDAIRNVGHMLYSDRKSNTKVVIT